MAYNGNEGAPIALSTASEWTANYRATGTPTAPAEPLAHFFGEKLILRILGQSGCVGIRIYYGIDGDGNKALIMVGADANQNDIIGTAAAPAIIGNYSLPCPMSCSSANSLNS